MFEYEGSRDEFLHLLAELGEEPAFVRRSLAVESSYASLIHRCQIEWDERIEWPKKHLASLRHRIGHDWSALEPMLEPMSGPMSGPTLGEASPIESFEDLWNAWQPIPASPTQRFWSHRSALRAFVDSVERFNRHWRHFIEHLDLSSVNEIRRDYNEYYPIERECAFGDHVAASATFDPIAMIRGDDVLDRFPLLEIPVLRTKNRLRMRNRS